MYPVGTKIYVAGEKRPYKVQASDYRYAIMTKSHFKTVLYSILDKVKKVRGADNMVFGRGYETKEQCEENLAALHDDMEVSRRNCVPLDVGGADWEIVKVVLPDGALGPLPKEVLSAQNN